MVMRFARKGSGGSEDCPQANVRDQETIDDEYTIFVYCPFSFDFLFNHTPWPTYIRSLAAYIMTFFSTSLIPEKPITGLATGAPHPIDLPQKAKKEKRKVRRLTEQVEVLYQRREAP